MSFSQPGGDFLLLAGARLSRSLPQNRPKSPRIRTECVVNDAFPGKTGRIDEMRAQAAASLSGARVQMVRLAALQILREVEGRPRRVVIDLETLLAEADGIARGLRSGFKPQDAPPARQTPMTADEESRLLAEIEDLKRNSPRPWRRRATSPTRPRDFRGHCVYVGPATAGIPVEGEPRART